MQGKLRLFPASMQSPEGEIPVFGSGVKRGLITMEYASKDIRNILVAGHAGCGKTSLIEALLYTSGATERMGRVEDRKSVV